MLSSHQGLNEGYRFLVQYEPGFPTDQKLSSDAKRIMAILSCLRSRENITASVLKEKTGTTPEGLLKALLELSKAEYLLEDRSDDELEHLL